MKRDMNLIRQIVLDLEKRDFGTTSDDIVIEGYTEYQITYHCELLFDVGYVVGYDVSTRGHKALAIQRLTSLGHDFADASRNESNWKKTISTISSKAGGFTADILLQYLKFEISKALGMSP